MLMDTYVVLSVFRLYNKMTMEVILSTAFGRAVDVQGGKGGKLFEAAMVVINAFTPSKENKSINVFKILQFLSSKLPCWSSYLHHALEGLNKYVVFLSSIPLKYKMIIFKCPFLVKE